MNKYRVTYKDDGDNDCPDFKCIIKAHNEEQCIEKFNDNQYDDGGWKIISIERIK